MHRRKGRADDIHAAMRSRAAVSLSARRIPYPSQFWGTAPAASTGAAWVARTRNPRLAAARSRVRRVRRTHMSPKSIMMGFPSQPTRPSQEDPCDNANGQQRTCTAVFLRLSPKDAQVLASRGGRPRWCARARRSGFRGGLAARVGRLRGSARTYLTIMNVQ